MELLKFCRVCLITGVKMYSLNITSNDSIGIMYSDLAQIQVYDQHVCFECASLLQKYQMFKLKCLRAHEILLQIAADNILTKEMIQNIDRKTNKLESSLMFSSTEICYEPFNDSSNNLTETSNSENVENPSYTYNDPLEASVLSIEVEIPKKEFEDNKSEVAIKCEVQSDEELNYNNNFDDVNDFSENGLGCSFNITTEIETSESKENCEDLREIDVSLDAANSSLDNVEKNDLINLSVVKKIPKVANKLVNSKAEKHKSIINKNIKNRKRKTVCNDLDTKIPKVANKLVNCKVKKHKSIINKNVKNRKIKTVCNDLDTKIPKTANKLVNCKVEKHKSIINKNIKNRKRKTVCNDLDTKIDKDIDNNLELEFGEYITIVSLSPDEARNELLSRKESRNYRISLFKCEFCYKGYEKIAAYENHMKMHSIENGEFECDICHVRFTKARFVCHHKESCHKRKFCCKLCPYICYNKLQAKNHVLFHKGTKYTCKDCGETFNMPHNLSAHKRFKHLNVSLEEVCEMCGDTFGPRGLLQHLKKLHRSDINNKEGPKCEECGVHFASEMAWKRHLVLSSKHIVVNGCKFCGETFSNVPDLKSHIRIDHPRIQRKKYAIELPGACPLCKEWLSNRKTYQNHMNREHPQSEEARKLSKKEPKASKKLKKPTKAFSYVCELCGQAFKHQCLLVYHQRKHTGERPYKCDDCGKAFILIGTLNAHRLETHLPKVPFECDICAREFASKSAIAKHMRAFHLGIRPHRCMICDKAFLHACDLKMHIKYAHGKLPWPKKKNKRNVSEDNSLQ